MEKRYGDNRLRQQKTAKNQFGSGLREFADSMDMRQHVHKLILYDPKLDVKVQTAKWSHKRSEYGAEQNYEKDTENDSVLVPEVEHRRSCGPYDFTCSDRSTPKPLHL